LDVHDYAGVANQTSDAGAAVQEEAKVDFDDLPHLRALTNQQSAMLILGETHSNTIDSMNGLTCEGEPSTAPGEMVLGFNQSASAGGPIIWQPWLNLAAPCYSYPGNVNVNPPYSPSQY